MGMVPADNLNPQKGRVLLMLALTTTHDASYTTGALLDVAGGR